MNKTNIFNACVLGGTSEGKILAELLTEMNVDVDYVTKEGLNNKFMKKLHGIKVLENGNEDQIFSLIEDGEYNVLIDATGSNDQKFSSEMRESAVQHDTEFIQVKRKNSMGHHRSARMMYNDVKISKTSSVEEICNYILLRMHNHIGISEVI